MTTTAVHSAMKSLLAEPALDCPRCGKPVVSELVYTEGAGYVLLQLCLGNESLACDYRRVL
jgi:hypothetical protein